MSESCIEVSELDSLDFPVIDISCIVLPYDVSFLFMDISCNEQPIDLSWNIIDNSCNSALWYSLVMDISNPNFISMDVSYALENNHMVFFSHESDIGNDM